MSVSFRDAVRSAVLLIIGVAGASGSGKTLSALKVARGLAGGDDSKIAFIDSENGRACHYAVAEGDKPDAEHFAFKYAEIRAPFTPEAYGDAIEAADHAGFRVIVIDSLSHEWEDEGGLHDMHDQAVEAAVARQRATAEERNWSFNEALAQDKASVGAWKEPKKRHKRFVNRLLQCQAHLVICLRAEEKMRMETVTDDRGRTKTVIVQAKDMPPAERWVPICEKRFMYEMTLSLILTPSAPGVPVPVKLQQQHMEAVPLDQQLSERTGERLAAWAAGKAPQMTADASESSAAVQQPQENAPALDVAALRRKASYQATLGTTALLSWWEKELRPAEQAVLAADKAHFKTMAQEADQRPTNC